MIALVSAYYFGLHYYRSYQEEKKKRKLNLVERIIEIIREATTRNGGIAEQTVRDILMPPTK